MSSNETHIVTGAFGFSGKYIAKRLLDAGYEVGTLTDSPDRANLFDDRVKAYPFNFGNPEKLIRSLEGASVLYNNYWVRFNYDGKTTFTYSNAVENSLKLFDAARKAGIRRIVHISITNPSEESPFEYFRGKAKLENALIESGISYAILRPAVLFGKEDILINNIAWFLRKFPVFGVFGDGDYRLQPIYVDDLAELAVKQGQKTENCIINAIGPETFTYQELVKEIAGAMGIIKPILYIPASFGFLVGSIVGKLFGDVTITKDEIGGLMAGLLYTNSKSAGTTRLTDWLNENAFTLGKRYSSELARRKNRIMAYEKL